MSNIFKNAERRVESFSFNKKDYTRLDSMSDATAGNQALRKMAIKESALAEEKQIEKENKHRENQRVMESIVNSSLSYDRRMFALMEWKKTVKTDLFKDILFEVYSNSLPLDTEFVCKMEPQLRNIVSKYVDDNGGMKIIDDAIAKTKSKFLTSIKKCCENVANEACNNKLKETDTINPSFEFELTNVDKEDFELGKKDLNLDQVADLVKNKVLTVVKDEKERETKEKELVEDIENELMDDDEVTDNATLDEAYQRIVLNKSPINEATLFNALMQDSYKEILTENMAIASQHESDMDDEDEFNLSYDVNYTEDEATCSKDMDITIANPDDATTIDTTFHMTEESSLNMDHVFAETLAKYTLMEMLYTMKLENYNFHDIRKMTEKLLNAK